jgi:hypothetical protein
MTTRKELDKLAQECEECVSKDSVSLNEHMDKCPQCQERKVKAEIHEQMVEAMQMMASKNEEDKSKILEARMEMITTLPEDKKITALIEMLDSLGELPQADMNKVVKSRTDLMMKMPKEKRGILIVAIQKIMINWDMDRKMKEKTAMTAATQDYGLLKRVMVRRMFQGVSE